MTCFQVYYQIIIYKEHKHYKVIKLEIKYKSNQYQPKELGFI